MVYTLARIIMFPLIRLWIKKVDGKENIPSDGHFIIAANHTSFLDDFTVAPIVIVRINKKVHMYCNDRFYKNKLSAAFLKWGECIPVSIETKNKETNRKALEMALTCLKKNEPIGIFPEGGRSYDGMLRAAKTGIAHLALLSKSRVLPVGIIGSHKVFPKGAMFPKLKRFSIKIGKPILLDKYYGKEKDKKVLKEVTDIVMKEIAALAGQEYRY